MTRHEIVALIKAGWQDKGYCSGSYTDQGNAIPVSEAKCVCAIGAAAVASGKYLATQFAAELEGSDWEDITSISDAAHSKGRAIEDLEKWADSDSSISFT